MKHYQEDEFSLSAFDKKPPTYTMCVAKEGQSYLVLSEP